MGGRGRGKKWGKTRRSSNSGKGAGEGEVGEKRRNKRTGRMSKNLKCGNM